FDVRIRWIFGQFHHELPEHLPARPSGVTRRHNCLARRIAAGGWGRILVDRRRRVGLADPSSWQSQVGATTGWLRRAGTRRPVNLVYAVGSRGLATGDRARLVDVRSEEHTSELQ